MSLPDQNVADLAQTSNGSKTGLQNQMVEAEKEAETRLGPNQEVTHTPSYYEQWIKNCNRWWGYGRG